MTRAISLLLLVACGWLAASAAFAAKPVLAEDLADGTVPVAAAALPPPDDNDELCREPAAPSVCLAGTVAGFTAAPPAGGRAVSTVVHPPVRAPPLSTLL